MSPDYKFAIIKVYRVPKLFRGKGFRWLVKVDGEPYRYCKTREEARNEVKHPKHLPRVRRQRRQRGTVLGHSKEVIAFFHYAALLEKGTYVCNSQKKVVAHA